MERLDKQFKIITRAAYERHGQAYGEVLTHWHAIAGERLAQSTRPQRLIWPRQAPSRQKLGATLVVLSDPAFALDLQYETPVLLERINQYFGYGAVAEIRVVRRAFAAKKRVPPRQLPEGGADETLGKQLAGIADDRLKAALSKLGRELKSRKIPMSRS